MEFKELAAKRYSCRDISGEAVKKELIEKIIEAGILAPTAQNKQPYKIFWMDSEEAKEHLSEVTGCTYGADAFLLVGSRPDESWVREFDNVNFANIDASIVATHMMMEICDLGLATTWVGYFDAPRLKEFYPQMKDYDLIALFPIGYEAETSVPAPRHWERKTMEEAVEVL